MTQAPERQRQDEQFAGKALLFDYRQAANPVRSGLTEPIPYRCWGPELHSQGPTAVLPLDLSAELGREGASHQPWPSRPFHSDRRRRRRSGCRKRHQFAVLRALRLRRLPLPPRRWKLTPRSLAARRSVCAASRWYPSAGGPHRQRSVLGARCTPARLPRRCAFQRHVSSPPTTTPPGYRLSCWSWPTTRQQQQQPDQPAAGQPGSYPAHAR